MPRLIYYLDPASLYLRRLERLIYILDHALLNLQHLERLIYSLDHALLNLQPRSCVARSWTSSVYTRTLAFSETELMGISTLELSMLRIW